MKLTLYKKDSPIDKIDLDIKYDEMLCDVITKFNDFRAPDNQINTLYNIFNQEVPLTFKAKSDLTLYYTIGKID